MSSPVCLNCETVNPPEHLFCSRCGQKMNVHRITLHEIFHDAVHYFTHADKGIFFLIKKLFRSPGVVAQEYLAGKRTQYFKPLNFFLLVAALLVFMTSLLGSSPSSGRRPQGSRVPAPMTEVERMKIEAQKARGAKVTKFFSKYSNFVNILATPLIVFFIFLFYLKGPLSYLEHLVANMYFVGFIMIFYALIFLPLMHMAQSTMLSGVPLYVFFLFEIIYRGIAYYQMMNQRGSKYLFKALGISLMATIFWAIFTTTLITTYIYTGWGGMLG